ncbi:MAG: hypothetical protein KAW12_25190 [Candidatus Aminicenantes bacterium]|nr:hypothetical protein [Candidatus Aminicenantes bacterium]
MKLLDRLGKNKEIKKMEDLSFDQRKYDDDFEYWAIFKNDSVGHLNKEKILFREEMDAEEWLTENYEKLQWGLEGIDEKDITVLFDLNLNVRFFFGSKEEILKGFDTIKKDIKNMEISDKHIGGANYFGNIIDRSYYKYGLKIIKMGERNENEKSSYREYNDLRSKYKPYIEKLGGNVFQVTGFLALSFFLLAVLSVFFIVTGIYNPEMNSLEIMLLFASIFSTIYAIPTFILRLRDFFKMKKIRRVLDFVS